ncbi:MAG: 3-dehydroquinate synthase [Acidobacteriota bacterium]|nr:3-dehydroquinate synthase [Acidobacteriota bacterium]
MRVDLGARGYDVHVGHGTRAQLASIIRERASRAKCAVIVTSPKLRALPWFDLVTGLETDVVEVPDGERAKTPETFVGLVETLAQRGLSRDDLVVAVGGGAITDLAGFAAASYLRGIDVLHVATSVAGQVDAAIGGKTGVNLVAGKNLLGAFHQPIAVVCDLDVLETLPPRDFRAGLGEVVKCALLEGLGAEELRLMSFEAQVELAISLKARVVSGDEREGSTRALLNYGHTLAHAMERASILQGHDDLRHGEAVAIGLAFAARLARALGRLDDAGVEVHDEMLASVQLPSRVPAQYDTADLLEAMSHDKKAHHDLTFVLAGPQGFSVVRGVDATLVRDELEHFRGES